MPYSKAKAKAFGKGPRAVIWPPYQGTRMDPVVRSNLMTAHWAAFANRLLRNYARKYMFKFWKIEKRRRAIIMRQNMARRTLIRTNPQYGPFRPIDIHECSSDSDDEPTISVARASSDAPTAAPGLPRQPVARIDRALDVLNAPGSTRQEFQAYFNPRNLGPGDLEELSPELWEELRLDGAVDEYDLHMQDMAEEEAQGTEPDLDRPPGLSEAAIADIPRTTLAGLEEQNPALYRDIVIGILETLNPHSSLSLRPMTNLDLMDQEKLLERRPRQGLPRVEDGNLGHHMVDLIMLLWLDVMFHTSLILLELTHSQ